jgi:hypothetical protein
MSYGGMAFAGAGLASSVIGAYYSGASQRESLRFQADMAAINARIAEQSAQTALLQGQRQEQASRLRGAQVKSSQRAAMAANGIDLSEGSAQNVLNTTDYFNEMDANTLAANATRSAWGYRTQATNYMNDALSKRSSADAISPAMGAASSLLTGGSQVADKWYAMNKAGIGEQTRLDTANASDDPLGTYGKSKGWW